MSELLHRPVGHDQHFAHPAAHERNDVRAEPPEIVERASDGNAAGKAYAPTLSCWSEFAEQERQAVDKSQCHLSCDRN